MQDLKQTNVTTLLRQLASRGIRLFRKDDRLGYQAPPGSLTESLRAAISAHRQQLLAALPETSPSACRVFAWPGSLDPCLTENVAVEVGQLAVTVVDCRALTEPEEPIFSAVSADPNTLCLFRTGEDRWQIRVPAVGYRHWSRIRTKLTFLQRAEVRLPELPCQYVDYAVWQRQAFEGGRGEQLLAFWKDHLRDAPPFITLNHDYPRPVITDQSAARVAVTLDGRLRQTLFERFLEGGGSMFMGLHAAFALVLSRYSQQRQVVIGTPVANRNHPDLMTTVGLFVNTLAIQVNCDQNATWETWFKEQASRYLAAFQNEDMPFERLVAALSPARETNLPPIFQVMFNLQTPPQTMLAVDALKIEALPLNQSHIDYDLVLEIIDDGTCLRLEFQYARALFKRSTIEGMAGHYRNLLSAIALQPTRPIHRLSMLDSDERNHLLWRLSGVEVSQATVPSQVLPELVENFRADPDRIVVVGPSPGTSLPVQLSGSALLAHATSVSVAVRGHGHPHGLPIPLFIGNQVELVIGILATWFARSPFVCLALDAPESRNQRILNEIKPSVVLVSGKDLTSDGSFTTITVPRNPTLVAPVTRIYAADQEPAYLIYTSGSTGRPKGVLVSHGSLNQFIHGFRDRVGIGPEDCTLQFTSPTFDVMIEEVLGSLSAGARLHIRKPSFLDLRNLLMFVAKWRLSLITLPTAYWHEWVHSSTRAQFEKISCLRQVVIGSEAAKPDMLERWWKHAPNHLKLHNFYGPAETTVSVLSSDVSRPRSSMWRAVPIGKPLIGAYYYLTDAHLELSPRGVAGELVIGGPVLAMGYHQRPALTAEAFVPNPFFGRGERLYRTGDKAVLGPDEQVIYLGRVDMQVKIRGVRVEPGEVASIIAGHPQVDHAEVTHFTHGDVRLGAAVIPAGDAFDTDDLSAYLTRHLPGAMIPSVIIPVTAFPTTEQGKIDRRKLVELLKAAAKTRKDSRRELPTTVLERAICDLWSNVLQVEQVSLHDNFFHLGGHSLLATRLINDIRKLLGRPNFKVQLLFENPTVAGFLKALDHKQLATTTEPSESEAVLIPVTGATTGLPLSFAQQRLWILDQQDPGAPQYNVASAEWIRGQLDPRHLELALRDMTHRHALLRARFDYDEGGADRGPVQTFLPSVPFHLQVTDLAKVGASHRSGALMDIAEAHAAIRFNLQTGYLFDIHLVCCERQRHLLLINMHHIITDDVSMRLFRDEWLSLYNARLAGRTLPAPMAEISYADYATWQRGHLRGKRLSQLIDFWCHRLADIPEETALPYRVPRTKNASADAETLACSHPPALIDRLHHTSRIQQTSVFITLLTAVQLFLGRYTSQRDLAIGIPVDGRSDPALEKVLGCFINTLVIRDQIHGHKSFTSALLRMQENLAEARAHEELPFDTLVRFLNPARYRDRTPLFQIFVNYIEADPGVDLSTVGHTVDKPDLQAAYERYTQFDLTITLVHGPESLTSFITYRSDAFEASTMLGLSKYWQCFLERLTRQPTQTVSRVDLLDEEEKRILLTQLAGTDGPNSVPGVLDQLRAQVDQQADAVAVEGPSLVTAQWVTLSYAALLARARDLARAIRGAGNGFDQPVPILLDHSVETVIAMIAAGLSDAPFVCLSPDLPEQRLQRLLRQLSAKVLITGERLARQESVTVLRALQPEVEPTAALPMPIAWRSAHAYWVFTSGSSGRPKGIAVSRASLDRFVQQFRTKLALTHEDRVLQFAAPTFDVAIEEVFTTLCSGGRLYIRDHSSLDPVHLQQQVHQWFLSVVILPTAYWHVWVHALESGSALPGSLRQVVIGSEAASPATVATWQRNNPAAISLLNSYGPAETTIAVTAADLEGGNQDPEGIVPIGRPHPGNRVYILDRDLLLLPRDVAGEMVLAGPGLASGYPGQPALTATVFVPNPFGRNPGERLYRTGDRAVFQADGQLAFRGRLDTQLKIRGFRIEPGEIERVLVVSPEVAEAAVTVVGGEAGDRLGVAFVPASSWDGNLDSIREHLRDNLPPYMVPDLILVLQSLPLTLNQKVDYRAIAERLAEFKEEAAVVPAGRQPKTRLEKAMCELWAKVLDVPAVTLDDHFFALGGHSLLAVKLMAGVRALTGRPDLSIQRLFEHPTPGQLVDGLDDHDSRQVQEPLDVGDHSIRVLPRDHKLPLSYAQQRLWLLDRMDPGAPVYNVPSYEWIHGPLALGLLDRALQSMLGRHHILRTRFEMERHDGEDRPVQTILPFRPRPMALTDVSNLSPAAMGICLRNLANDHASQRFQLEDGRVFDIQIVRCSETIHLILINMHHIVTDEASMRLFRDEWLRLYHALVAGEAPPNQRRRIRYADFAAWQRQKLDGEHYRVLSAYWRRQLADLPADTVLPYDKPRPAQQTADGAVVTLDLDWMQVRHIRRFGQANQTSPFVVVLAAAHVLLARYSDRSDIAIGVPVSGRIHPETESLIGYFVNSLVIRGDLGTNPSFIDWLTTVRETWAEALRHRDMPFDDLVSMLNPSRELNRTPLFQMVLNYQELDHHPSKHASTQGPPGFDQGWTPIQTQFDLNLTVLNWPDGMRILFIFKTDLFLTKTISRLARHYQRVLSEGAACPAQSVYELEMLRPADRRALLRAAQGVPVAQRSVVACFETVANTVPDRVALSGREREDQPWCLTYAALDDITVALVRSLQRRNLTPGSIAAVLDLHPEADAATAIRDPALPVLFLAIARAGATYLPLVGALPRRRVSVLLADTAPALAILAGNTPSDRPWPCAWFHAEALIQEAKQSFEDDTVLPVTDASDALYVMYTSGSTGLPKGVMVTHAGVVRLIAPQTYARFRNPAPRTLFLSQPAFDASTLEIWAALLNGGRCTVLPAMAPGDQELALWLQRECIDTLWLTATMFNLMVDSHPRALASVKQLLSGGEALSVPHVRAAYEHLPDIQLINGYGPTENTTFTCCYPIPREIPDGEADVPIGQAIAGTSCYVVDRRMRLVPTGVPGELVTGGDGLAIGYLYRAAATAASFVPNPFSRIPGDRLYKTGDRVRLAETGSIRFLGRADKQVKIRGHRIEPGEVANQLLRHLSVAQAYVRAMSDPTGSLRLVGYVTGEFTDESTVSTSCRSFLEETLPSYMVPAHILLLDQFPMTANGKLNVASLPTPAWAGHRTVEAPQSETERLVADIWADVLGLPSVGRDAHFFELGGHSLRAMRVMNHLRHRLSVDLPLRELFVNPRLPDFAARLATFQRGREGSLVIPRLPRDQTLPLSFAQSRLWFLQQWEPGSAGYNVPLGLRLHGALDIAGLLASFEDLMVAQETLRTGFPVSYGEPNQFIVDQPPLPAVVVDASSYPQQTAQTVIQSCCDHYAARAFRLDQPPLWYLIIGRITADDHVLFLNMHHIITDAWSLDILVKTVAESYTRRLHGEAADIPTPEIQYTDYAHWQQQRFRGEAMAASKRFWLNQLADLPSHLDLPTDSPRADAEKRYGAPIALDLSAAETQAWQALLSRRDATPYMGFLAVFAWWLHGLTQQHDLAIGSPVSNRDMRQLEALIGFFVNTLVLRLKPDGQQSFDGLLSHVSKVHLDAMAHREMPFEHLVQLLQPERDLHRHPLFQAMFQVHGVDKAWPAMPGLRLAPMGLAEGEAKFDLSLTLLTGGPRWSLMLAFNQGLFKRKHVSAWAARLHHLVKVLPGVSKQPLQQVPLFSEAERHALLRSWQGEDSKQPEAPLLLTMLAETVRSAPDAAALVTEPGNVDSDHPHLLTYKAWWRRARQLADHLRGDGSPVGLMMGRTGDTVAAMLACWQADRPYLPVDPSWPAARIAQVLTVAGSRSLIHDQDLDQTLQTDRQVLDSRGLPVLWSGAREDFVPEIGPRDRETTAYVLFTSGSTGEPKGVQISQGAAANYTAAIRNRLGWPGGLNFGLASTLAADLGNTVVFGAWATGGCLHVLSQHCLTNAHAFHRYLHAAGIDVLKIVPSHLQTLHESIDDRPALPRRHLVLGGEAADPVWFAGLWDVADRPVITNHYGPTETTVGLLTASATGPQVPGIGYPLQGNRAYLLDKQMNPRPSGSIGELMLAGANCARGYVGRPALTADRFIPDPFAGQPGGGPAGARMYRTGDRARFTADHGFVFQGRVDRQLKLRGFRIEPGEIAHQLQQVQTVRRALVDVLADQQGNLHLVAWVVLEVDEGTGTATREFDSGAVRTFLLDRLPAYMVPDAILPIDQIPLTANGKVDFRALPNPGFYSTAAKPVIPQDIVEHQLNLIWQRTLQRDTVGKDDSFFDLGGHSLLATRMLAQVEQSFRVSIRLLDLFRHPTIGRLADQIRERRRASQGLVRPPLVPRTESGELAQLSFSQQRLWFLYQWEGSTPTYNVPRVVDFTGDLDVSALAHSLETLIQRHEILRTRYIDQAGEARGLVDPCPNLIDELTVVDLGGLAEAGSIRDNLTKRSARQGIDLVNGPVIRLALLRLAPDQHRFLSCVHHIACDGISAGVMASELSFHYRRALFQDQGDLPALPVQYSDYAVWQRQWLRGDALDRQVAFWRENLAEAPPLTDLPLDYPRPPRQTYRGTTLPFFFDEATQAAVDRLANQSGTTHFAVFTALFAILLSRLTGQTDLVLGTPVAGRNHPDLEPLIGFLINTLVLRIRLDADPTLSETFPLVQEILLQAQDHGDVPFERLVEELQTDRDPALSPLFQVMIVWTTYQTEGLAMPGLDAVSTESHHGIAKFDLTLFVGDQGGLLEYNTDLFRRETIEQMAACFEFMVKEAAGQLARPVSRLALASDEQVLGWLNAPVTRMPDRLTAAIEAGCPTQIPATVGQADQGNLADPRQCYILSPAHEVQPLGVTGELYVETYGLQNGGAIPNPLAGRFKSIQSGSALVATGELVKRDHDGSLVSLGRSKDRLTVRGVRIPTERVGDVLCEHPAVAEVFITARENHDGGYQTVAYLVPEKDAKFPEDTWLRRFLNSRLPHVYCPNLFVTMTALPISPDGSVDTQALPDPDQPTKGANMPASALQKVLSREDDTLQTVLLLWIDLLEVEDVSPGAGFFDLGGHSLSAMRLLARIQTTFGVEIPLRDFFQAPTPADLAATIKQHRQKAAALTRPLLVAADDNSAAAPLSFSQQRLWFLDQWEGASATYNVPRAVRLLGLLSPLALGRAYATLQQRHAVLRTTYPARDGQPLQQVCTAVQELALVDLSHLDPELREAAARDVLNRHAAQPFNLAEGPLVRALVLRLDAEMHLLVTCLHHIASDGWSAAIVIREMGALYGAFARGESNPLTPLPIQYADFARWQRRWLQGDVLTRFTTFWREQLIDAPALCSLPTDRPRPAFQSNRGAVFHMPLRAGAGSGVFDLAKRLQLTPFNLLVSTFAWLLGRYAGEEDVVLGSPVSGRTMPETEDLIGFFINSLVLRVQIRPQMTVADLFRATRDRLWAAQDHAELPFEKMVEEIKPERTTGYSPIFQVQFIYQNNPGSRLQLPLLQGRVEEAAHRVAKYDLTVGMDQAATGMTAEYNADLYDQVTIHRFLKRFERLISLLVSQPDSRLDRIDWLDADERRAVLEEWALNPQTLPRCPGLFQRFDAQVKRAPDRVVLREDRGLPRFVSGDCLLRSALARGAALASRGLGPGRRLALCGSRDGELVSWMLATSACGAAYVPMDPVLPQDRLRYMIDDAAPAVVVTTATEKDRLGLEETLFLDWNDGRSAASEAIPIQTPIAGSQPVYAMYTSGSTGRPKAAIGTLDGVWNRLAWMWKLRPFEPAEVLCQKTSISFVDAVWELFGPLLQGVPVVVIDDAVVRDPAWLTARLRAEYVSRLVLTPSLLQTMLDLAGEDGLNLPRLTRWTVSGEAVEPTTVAAFRRAAPEAELLNLYGSTEVAADATWHPVTEAAGEPVPIGQPVANTGVWLLDRAMRPVPPGLAGQIFVGGAGLSSGYAGRAGLTADRFVPHPFATEPGERLYATGDWGRHRSDGALLFSGRLDRQVKLRGYRIEPGEIERTLSRCEAVDQSAVVVVALGDGDVLAAAVTLRQGGHLQAVQDYAADQLPGYMVPRRWAALDAMPVNVSGKLDRLTVAERLREIPEPEPETDAADEVDNLLGAIWSEVLACSVPAGGSDFFALGGHSLGAARVVARIREVLGVELPLKSFFAHPTLAAMASIIRDLRRGTEIRRQPIRPRVEHKGPLPLSFAQQRLWFLDRLEMDPARRSAYNIMVAQRLHGALDLTALHQAWSAVCERHAILRTHYPEHGGEPYQAIAAKAQKDAVVVIDLSGQNAESHGRRLATRRAGQPFDLAARPPWQLVILRFAGDDHVVLLALHHILTDGWTTRLLIADWSRAYRDRLTGQPPSWPGKTVDYADYAIWQRSHLSGARRDTTLQFWKDYLRDAPTALDLPGDRPRPKVPSFAGARVRSRWPESLTGKVIQAARDRQVTPFMLLQAGCAALLGRWGGAEDLCLGTPVAGRTDSVLESVAGMFVNTLVIRHRITRGATVADWLARVRESVLDAFSHQDVPFEQVVDAVAPPRLVDRHPLFQVMVVLQNMPTQTVAMTGLNAEPFTAEQHTTRFDLTINVTDGNADWLLLLEYNRDVFDRETIERFDHQLRHLLDQLSGPAERRLDQIDWLPDADKSWLKQQWSRSESMPEAPDVWQAFERQVKIAPNAVALVFEDTAHIGAVPERQLTYGALAGWSCAIAADLVQRGVRPGQAVGVALPRSPEMVAAILGILAAGAVYVPLDPEYPEARLAVMTRDAGAVLVLTAPGAPATHRQVIETQPVIPFTAAGNTNLNVLPVQPENLAYIIFTSGTSGRPKGVAVTRGSIANLVAWDVACFSITARDRTFHVPSINFDVASSQLFLTLGSGAALGIANLFEPARQLRDWCMTYMGLAAPALAAIPPGRLPHLRAILIGGEACAPGVLAAWQKERCIFNEYGPTETTVAATVDRHQPGQVLTIGRPVAGARCYVLDTSGRPLPANLPGELFIGGTGVARGYIGKAAATAAVFLPDPFAVEPGSRMYRSGDRVMLRSDGRLAIFGRMDRQVKLRGVRIEIEDIERHLAGQPTVREAAVRLVETESPYLAAYLTPAEPDATAHTDGGWLDAVRAALRQQLPDVMIPEHWQVLSQMPLTPNGKIDRSALPEPEAAVPAVLTPPRNQIERTLTDIWESLLGQNPAGVDQNFFELGGHSLLLPKLQQAIEQGFDVTLPILTFFRQPTIAGQAKVLAEQAATGESVAAEPFSANDSDSGQQEPKLARNRRNLVEEAGKRRARRRRRKSDQ